MKSNTLLIIILSILGVGLILSTMYDKKINADEIVMYQCENNSSIYLPTEYLKPELQEDFNAKKKKYKIENSSIYWDSRGLTGLPDDIFKNYPCIKQLDISSNEFTTIPTAISDLKDLQSLSLEKNRITSAKNLNIDYREFQDLELINLSNNLIDTLDFIPITNTFFDLDVSNNKIKHVSFINSSNRFLNSLNLFNNQLKTFPYDYYRLRNLTKLNIGSNEISGKVVLQGLEELEILDISNQMLYPTRITSIEVKKNSCKDLVTLKAQNNDISSFIFNYTETDRNPLIQLEVINFHSNKFTNFPRLIYDCPEVKLLDLSDNKLSYIRFKYSMRILSQLNLSNNQLTEVRKLNKISNIQILDLSHNKLTRFPFFNDNVFLSELNLSYNNIDTLSHFLNNRLTTKSFRKLDLSHNQIKTFDKSSSYVVLEELNLSNNAIASFYCSDYPKLRKLDLSNNILEGIICEKTYAFRELEVLDLSNNPNLRNIPIVLFDSSRKLKIINIENTNLGEDLIRFLINYCDANGIKLIR
jgi:Leucine-rich repeat (LRR) protein